MIKFLANKVMVEPLDGYNQIVEVDGYTTKEIIESLLDQDDSVYDAISLKQIVKQYDKSEILDEIGIDSIKEYLELNGITQQ